MPRTVIPPPRLRGVSTGGTSGGDGLADKLVKYVPAETLAFFVPLSAALGNSHNALLIVVICAGLLGNLGWLWSSGRRLPKDEQPTWYFYVLAELAFLAWALGTNPNVGALVHVGELAAGVVLGIAVFLIPVADQITTAAKR